jgi:hypothetical protein
MTEQPPVTTDNPTDGGQGAPPTPTEQQAEQTQQQTTEVTEPLGYADHTLYAQALYQQPSWVVAAVFTSGKLDQTQKYLPTAVQSAINEMMMVPDTTFTPEATQ